MILKSHREYKRTATISNPMFNFGDCYAEILEDKMLDLMKAIQDKFKEEISNEIFSIIYLKIKEFPTNLYHSGFFVNVFFAVEESDLLILVQFAIEFLLTIAMLQENVTVRLLYNKFA